MTQILLLEDDNLLGQELMDAFKEANISAIWTHSVDEAIQTLGSQTFELAFLDIMLSGSSGDGFTVLRHIKHEPKLHALKVVVLTNVSPITEINRATELGADDYIVKASVDMERVIEIASRYLKGI